MTDDGKATVFEETENERLLRAWGCPALPAGVVNEFARLLLNSLNRGAQTNG